ncbi:hypothetical protein FRUB_04237 [Fimbriiglobus ruber]|uniref:Uncharacterized protein n=2 Tax=Fimbriiglobus ruber TaxID=1908690 RepID=A0A225DY34_9BACT|nr:hypothetical protein FRUB_04237 [Fimbriiglobus ruber]
MVRYSCGNTERDFHVNGHHMNEEFGLWISDGKVIHDDGTDFVPRNKWYDLLGVPGRHGDSKDERAQFFSQPNNSFRPQSTRGSAPANVATLLAKGIDL